MLFFVRMLRKQSLLHYLSSVHFPDQILADVDSQEVEVHNRPLGFCSVQEQVVFSTPHCQMLHLIPVGGLIGQRQVECGQWDRTAWRAVATVTSVDLLSL